MRYATILIALLAASIQTTPALAQHNLDEAMEAWPDLKVFDAKDVRNLSNTLRKELAKRNCRIPLFTKWDGRHNVISGSFLAPGNKDVAVLCLAGDDMSIIVFPNGSPADAQEIRKFPANALRMIHTASPFVLKKKAIRDKVVDRMPEFDHDAIEDGPVGERSETTYFNTGNWITVF